MSVKENTANIKDKFFGFAKKATEKTKVFVQEKVDNHNVNKAQNKLKHAYECLENLEDSDAPKLPKGNEINTSSAREIISLLSNNQEIVEAVQKGRILNENIRECTVLLNNNRDVFRLLPETYQPKMPVLSQVNQDTIRDIQKCVILANTCKRVEEEYDRINKLNPVEVPLSGFYKAYGIDAYRFAADQMDNPDLVLGAAAAAATRGVVSGGIAVASIVGTAVSSFHKAGIDVIINNMKMYLPDLKDNERRTLVTLFALESMGAITSQQFSSAYYGYAFNEGDTFLAYEDYEKAINNTKDPSKAEKISLGCAAYLLESTGLSTRAQCKELCQTYESTLEGPVLDIIRNKLSDEN